MRAQTWPDLGIELPPGAVGEIDTTCPQCSPTRKKSRARCLSVNTLTGCYFCHHCGWAGALGSDAGGYGAPLRHVTPSPAAKRMYATPDPLSDSPLPPEVARWFAARGIPEPILADAGVRWADGAILFPYWRHGTLVNIKHRTLDKRFWMVAGAERILYGLDGIVSADIILIVEGEIDALTIRAVGGPPCVSVPDGAPANDARHYETKFSFLDAHALRLLQAAKIVLIGTDMDPPGCKLADQLARRIGYATCARVSWPDGCKDSNDTLVTHGAGAVLRAIASAQPYPAQDTAKPPHRSRPIRPLPPVRARRTVIDLTDGEERHAGQHVEGRRWRRDVPCG